MMNNILFFCIAGHAGHDEPPARSARKIPALEGNEAKYGLAGQLEHKAEFIRQYVPRGVKVHLIGHSIGAWMLLELLKIPDIKDRIHHGYLLFPAIEHMRDSPNGWIYTHVVQRFWMLLAFIINVFAKLPQFAQIMIIYMYFFVMSIPKHFVGTALKYSRPSVLHKIVYLADEEMKQVIEPDYEVLKANVHRLKLYYGSSDGWSPVSYCHRLCDKVPGLDASVDIYKYAHAFVLRSSVEMGKLVGGWISQNRST